MAYNVLCSEFHIVVSFRTYISLYKWFRNAASFHIHNVPCSAPHNGPYNRFRSDFYNKVHMSCNSMSHNFLSIGFLKDLKRERK